MACFGAIVACGNDALHAAGDDANVGAGAPDASVAETSIPAPSTSSPPGDGATEIVIGDGSTGDAGSDADADATADADADADADAAPPAVDAGPCSDSAFYEEWNIDDTTGAWIPGTTWTVTGPAPDASYFPVHGGYFTTNAASYVSHPLLPACHYAINLPLVPPSPMPNDLTFLRITSTDPTTTVSFALTSSTDDAGVVHGFISVRLGGDEILKNEIAPTALTGVGLTYTTKGSLVIGTDGSPSGEYFFGPDAGPFPGFDAIEVGVVDGPTASAESLYFGVISTQWNETL